jgi:hypothetical protein
MKIQIQKLAQKEELFHNSKKSPSFCDQVFLCKCFHFEHSHNLGFGKCFEEGCNCERFENGTIEFSIRVYEKFEEIEIREYEGGLF